MINSRDLKELHPTVAGKAYTFVERCRQAGIDLLITSTYRDKQSQDALYAQGRSKEGKIVTNAKGGQSFHNYRVALDVVSMRNGNGTFDNPTISSKPHPSWPVGDRFLNVGYDADGVTDGYINDLRISDYAVYTSAFTPPTAALT